MARRILLTLFLSFMLQPLFVCASMAANLVSNGTFSDVSPEGVPKNWTLIEQEGARCTVVDDDGYTEHHSLLVRVDGTASGQPVAKQTISCTPDTQYILSVWSKAKGPMRVFLELRSADNQHNPVLRIKLPFSDSWQQKTVPFNSGPFRKIDVLIVPKTQGAEGMMWIDDILIRKATGESPRLIGLDREKQPRHALNIALHKPYKLVPRPNYSYCTDAGDSKQLTDGEYVKGYFWVQKGTVGWSHANPVTITIDLGRIEPIEGLSFDTAAGTAGVGWPQAILIFVSDDGKEWWPAGNLVELAAKHGLPAPDKYSVHRFVTHDLKTHGRYVKLILRPGGSYLFCDEIEIYRGPENFLGLRRTGKPVKNTEAFVRQMAIDAGIKNRLRTDAEIIRKLVEASKLSPAEKEKALQELSGMRDEIDKLPSTGDSAFKAIVPMNSLHARIFALHARVLKAAGFRPLTVWHSYRYDPLAPTDTPRDVPKALPSLSVTMMNGEYRAKTINLTNATDRPALVRVSFEGLPGSPAPTYVSVRQVEFVDTAQRVLIADPLPEARRQNGAWIITVPAGITRQIWFSFHPTNLKAQTCKGRIVLASESLDAEFRVPLALRVSSVKFPKHPTCSLGVWDYSDLPVAYDLRKTDRRAAIADMKEHFVDTPWAHSSTAPKVTSENFEKTGRLIKQPDFAAFDEWVTAWKGARHYFVFLSVGDSFAGFQVETPPFRQAVGDWAKAWAKHNRAIGLKPRQVGVLLVDEPHRERQNKTILGWAKAIKAATDEILIFEDPTFKEPWKAPVQEMFTTCDILCPNLTIFSRQAEKSRAFYGALRKKGITLWFYQCSGPARLFDPYYYHRLQHWYCWKYGAKGSGFWAYCDAGGGNSWMEYAAGRTSYSPVYFDPKGVTDGKHWEAVREGIEDYEYFRMLRDAVDATNDKTSPAAREAAQLLNTLPEKVAGTYDTKNVSWSVPKDRTLADKARLQVLDALEKLLNLQK